MQSAILDDLFVASFHAAHDIAAQTDPGYTKNDAREDVYGSIDDEKDVYSMGDVASCVLACTPHTPLNASAASQNKEICQVRAT